MIRSSLFRSLSAILSAFVIASCADSSVSNLTAPSEAVAGRVSDVAPAAPALNRSSSDRNDLELRAVWWKGNQRDEVRVSQTIDASGGTISIPKTGLTMIFPRGAVAARIKITVTSDEKYVAYKMEPTGTKFLKDVIVIQSLRTTELGGHPLRSQLFAAYIADDRVKLSGKVPVLEIEPSHTIFSEIFPLIPVAHVWIIRHFSRYMLASG